MAHRADARRRDLRHRGEWAEGFRFDEDDFQVDAIDEVGPAGHFLDQEHTLLNMREFWRETFGSCSRRTSRSRCPRAWKPSSTRSWRPTGRSRSPKPADQPR
ncbi:MAG: trimethylamine methyltransferase family protein [Actinomycetota bacterium]